MCYLLLTNEQIALNAYQLSLHEEQHFPFALTGINLSQICLQTLRQGHLNRILNSKNDVFNTFNLFYCSLFLKFFQLWSDGKKTIVDSNDVLKGRHSYRNSAQKPLVTVFSEDYSPSASYNEI